MNAYVMSSLPKIPALTERILRKVDPAKFDLRENPERFTIRESVAHLADWDPIFIERFKVGLDTPGGTIVVYDEGQIAIDHKYFERDVFEECARFSAGRAQLTDLLKGLSKADWDKTILHPEQGVLTLANFASIILGHDVYHLDQFAAAL